jgi:predicted 3-demethylubiquinone-9 3-methyltransferase (glyoxalase superfamily)
MPSIVPHLWFDRQAREAAELYASLFPSSRVTKVTSLENTPSGSTDIVQFELWGQPFMSISAGPLFRFNPSISFHVKCDSGAQVDHLWKTLSEGGTVLMPLGTYSWSTRYGWLNDRYGLSWQLAQADPTDQHITPVMMFVGDGAGRAEQAITQYLSTFPQSRVAMAMRYGAGEAPDKEGTLKYATFELLGQQFGAMDSARPHDFTFNEAVSFIVMCDTQQEIDHYWDALTSGGNPKAQQCGWLKDPYGVSWQVTPSRLGKLLQGKHAGQVTQAFLKMKKLDIAELEQAAAE